MKKIGHTGTLDPEAEGVLPVCLGKATGLCSMITDWGKTYEAVMLLGTTTDTQDTTGTVTAENEVHVTELEVIEACSSFVGEYYQTPPMYSALKYKGHKLYELASQGIEIERAARKITIHALHINEMNFYGVTGRELGGIVEQLRLTEGVEVAIFLYQTGEEEYKVSLRSKKVIDVSEIAMHYGGGGHIRAAGFTANGAVHDIINNIGARIEEQYNALSGAENVE